MNGDGVLGIDELREVLKGEPEEKVQAYLKEVDRDGDGRVSYVEFLRMLLPGDVKYRMSTASSGGGDEVPSGLEIRSPSPASSLGRDTAGCRAGDEMPDRAAALAMSGHGRVDGGSGASGGREGSGLAALLSGGS